MYSAPPRKGALLLLGEVPFKERPPLATGKGFPNLPRCLALIQFSKGILITIL